MFDLTSIIIVAGLFFGLVASTEALNGDTLRVQIDVPQSVAEAGFTEEAAEALFLAEAARLVRGESIIPTPTLRMQTSASVVSVLAKPLNLDRVVTALQNQLGIDHLVVACAILAESTGKEPGAKPLRALTPGTKLDMLIIVTQPKQMPVQIVLEQQDGDVTTLVRRAATWAMEQVSPYRVTLAHFLDGVNGDPSELAAAKSSAERFISQPWDITRASERAMTYNVLALLALLDSKEPEAHALLELATAIPNVLPQALAVMALNHSFISLSELRVTEASELLAAARRRAGAIHLNAFDEQLKLQDGLIAWARGDLTGAEASLRSVLAAMPNYDAAHQYLARLLRAKGDAAGAAAEEAAQRISRLFQARPHAVAQQLFWLDPVKGGLTRRE